MYYLELIQRFWEFNKLAKISPSEITLYFYILKTAFENKRYDFKISDSRIARELGMTRKTVKSAKEKLQAIGLIEFQAATGIPCYYRVLLNYSLDFKSDKIQELAMSTGENLLNSNADTISSEDKNRNNININIPSFEEIMEFVRTLDIYEQQLDSIIKEKYDNWIKNGWKNSLNRPISNWKSTLKSTLPYMRHQKDKGSISLKNVPKIERPHL